MGGMDEGEDQPRRAAEPEEQPERVAPLYHPAQELDRQQMWWWRRLFYNPGTRSVEELVDDPSWQLDGLDGTQLSQLIAAWTERVAGLEGERGEDEALHETLAEAHKRYLGGELSRDPAFCRWIYQQYPEIDALPARAAQALGLMGYAPPEQPPAGLSPRPAVATGSQSREPSPEGEAPTGEQHDQPEEKSARRWAQRMEAWRMLEEASATNLPGEHTLRNATGCPRRLGKKLIAEFRAANPTAKPPRHGPRCPRAPP